MEIACIHAYLGMECVQPHHIHIRTPKVNNYRVLEFGVSHPSFYTV